jgi:hypothetical protein
MICYTYAYLIISLVGFIFYFTRDKSKPFPPESKSPPVIQRMIFNLLVTLPFIGRVLGWW